MSSSSSASELEEDYYAFLNVRKTATAEEISAAYKALSRIYHPDKNLTQSSKKDAEIMFNRTKRAYEVLSDPQQRAIYDCVGAKGLKTTGWEMVQRMKTPAEIREEYQRLAEGAEERRMHRRTNPKTTCMLNVNATDLFNPYGEEMHVDIRSMSMTQSIEAPISHRDLITVSGNMYSANGNGGGGVLVSGRRLIDKGYFAVELGTGNGLLLGLKGQRTLHPKVTVGGGTNLNFINGGLSPSAVANLSVQVEKYTVAGLTFNLHQQPSLVARLDRNTAEHGWSTSVTLDMRDVYLTIAYTHKFIEEEMKLKLAFKAGSFGFMGEYGVEKKVSKYTTVNATMSIGVPTGVILKLKVSRSTQVYVLPIHLSEEVMPAPVFYGTILPVLAWFVIKKTMLEPMEEKRRVAEVERKKKLNEERLAEKRNEAAAAINLLQGIYQRVLTAELQCSGLIISKATYGALSDNGTDFRPDASIDVTLPVQCLVKESKLQIYNAKKHDLPGFYDPCIGEQKVLRVEYSYNQQTNTVTVRDQDTLLLPR